MGRILTAAWSRIVEEILNQRGQLFCWVPVVLSIGIGWYFALPAEPSVAGIAAIFAGALFAGLLARRSGAVGAPLLGAVALIALGFGWAGARAHLVGAPVLDFRYYGPVEGRVIALDRSASDAVRVTLDRVQLLNVGPEDTPARVRLSLHGKAGTEPRPGARVMTTAHLSPPSGPVEPGGFDFQRHAWFLKLGGVGYTRVPLMALAPPGPGETLLFRARLTLSSRIQAALPGETGAFAAALAAGDRAGMEQETLDALRISNLAHLLAISGLHMGLLAGFVFALIRVALSLPPRIALYWPVKEIASIAALVAGAFYLALSGWSVATERAFVMVALALLAVLARRRAISLRGVALAAVIVLALHPDALLSPGFQMSFAATIALVAVFGVLRDRTLPGGRWVAPVLTLILSSAVAGFATAPVGAAHFNQISHYGLAANLLSVPLMGVLVIPAAVVAVMLMPLGLEALPLTVMGWGLDWILGVAHFFAVLPGARGAVPAPPQAMLPLFALGALFVILWQGRLRWIGLVPVAAAFVLWSQADRPQGLIADNGGLVGWMTAEGRALSRDRGSAFIAEGWLEDDGDLSGQVAAAARWPGAAPLIHVTGKRAAAALGPCTPGQIVVLNVPRVEAPGATGCDIFDTERLRETGALAVSEDDGRLLLLSAREVSGSRYWNTPNLWRPVRPGAEMARFVAKFLPAQAAAATQ